MKGKTLLYIVIGIVIGSFCSFLIFNIFYKKDSEEVNKSYVEVKDEDIVNYIKDIDDKKDESSLKNGFIKVVDFIFYDGEIMGKRLNELKDETKVKIYNLFYSIDSKVDSLYPDYKEKIFKETGRIYTNLKEKTLKLYINTIDNICENNDDFCEKTKENFNKIKEKFKISYDKLKTFTKEEINKLEEWYINYKNN